MKVSSWFRQVSARVSRTALAFTPIIALLASGCSLQPSVSSPSGAQPDTARASQAPGPAAGISPSPLPVTLNVFAAASLTEAFQEIGAEVHTLHPEINLAFNFAGSQQLAQQIDAGAPADLFASAGQPPLEAVIQAGHILTGTVQIFARNRLVVVYPRGNPAGLESLSDLGKPGLKLIFATREVPVGQYTLAFLDKAAQDPAYGPTFKTGVLDNVVSYEESVRAVLSKIILGEADAGVVYTSDLSGLDASQAGRLDIPDALNIVAEYPLAPLRESAHPQQTRAVIDFILSPAGQAILAKYGFRPAKS